MPNKGEQAEYRHALMLYKLTQNPVAAEALFGPDASQGITLLNQETKKQIEREEDIPKKAGASYKADHCFRLNKTGELRYPSSKYLGGGKASLLNPTARNGFKKNHFLAQLLEGEAGLDSIIKKHHEHTPHRQSVPVVSLELDENQKKTLKKALCYFLFTGTAKGNSKMPANAMMTDDTFTDCRSQEQKMQYIEKIWARLVIVLRPFRGSKRRYIEEKEECKPWIYKWSSTIEQEKLAENGKHWKYESYAEKTETHVTILWQQLQIRLSKA